MSLMEFCAFVGPNCSEWEVTLLCLCNENQLDALFILSLFRQSASTYEYFGHIYSSSSGAVRWLSVGGPATKQ